MKYNLRLGFLAIFLTFAHGFVIADTCTNSNSCSSESCNTCDLCLDFDLFVDFLYWKPCVGNLEYAAEKSGVTTEDYEYDRQYKYKKICPDWESGVRLTVAKSNLYCDLDMRASWTYINADESSSFRKDKNVIALLMSPIFHNAYSYDFLSKADSKWEATYHEWDILFAYDIELNNCHFVSPFFGFAGLVLDQDLEAVYFMPTTISSPFPGNKFMTADWESEYWGVGLRAGTTYEYLLSDCLALFSNVSGSILAGEADTKYVMRQLPKSDGTYYANIIVKDRDDCRFVPGFHLATGFIYDACYCGYYFSFKLAYEILNWYNIPSHRVFTGQSRNDEPIAQHGTRTFGFHGLTAGLEFSF